MTPAVRAVAQRVEVLRLILVAAGLDNVPVTGALCFVDGLLPLSVADLEVGGMHVLRPSGLTALVAGFVGVIWAFVKEAFERARHEPEQEYRLALIRNLLVGK